jgi:hypothetical protein
MITAFLKLYWKEIAIVAAICAALFAIKLYINSVYNDGKAAGIDEENKVWLAREATRIEKQNAAIDELEKVAKDLADARQKELAARDAKIAELDKKLAGSKVNTVIYTRDGKVQICPSIESIYLGQEFSKLWNQYNIEAAP